MSNIAELQRYAEDHSSPELPILTKIYRETNIRYLNPRMISGHIQGTLLSLISKMIKPFRILEIGTFTGYSAICLSQGLQLNGLLHTIEINDEIAEVARNYFTEAFLNDKIMLHVGNAIDIIPTLKATFDLIFIDGEKCEYPEYYKICINYLNPNGYLIADNVLWDGKVIDSAGLKENSTKGVLEFNQLIYNDAKMENLLLPLRDGLMIARKVE